MEPVGRDVKLHEERDFCLFGGGGGVDGSGGNGGADGSGGSGVVDDSVGSGMFRSNGGGLFRSD